MYDGYDGLGAPMMSGDSIAAVHLVRCRITPYYKSHFCWSCPPCYLLVVYDVMLVQVKFWQTDEGKDWPFQWSESVSLHRWYQSADVRSRQLITQAIKQNKLLVCVTAPTSHWSVCCLP